MNLSRVSSVLAALAVLATASLLRAQDRPPAKQFGYTVTVELAVDANGKPVQPEKIAESEDHTPDRYLDAMALLMAAKTQFPPHLKDGKPVAFNARVPFFFPIEGDEGPAAQQEPMAHPRMDLGNPRKPVYPPDLAEKGEVGGAILELSIDDHGNVTELKTVRASNPKFADAALTAVKTWVFGAAKKGDQPVASRFSLAIVFDTDKDKADLKWRIAPRPTIGSFIVMRDTRPVAAPPESGPAAEPKVPAALAPEPGSATPTQKSVDGK